MELWFLYVYNEVCHLLFQSYLSIVNIGPYIKFMAKSCPEIGEVTVCMYPYINKYTCSRTHMYMKHIQ